MVISFSSFQCKRAHPPHLEDVIAIRKIRERRIERKRRDIEPLRAYGKSEFTGYGSYLDYEYVPWDGSIVPQPAHPIYVDSITHKQFKVPTSPNEHEILKMFKFYGVDINKKYQCPVCNLEADMRTLLPHLNNDRGVNVFMVDGFEDKFQSHGWNFKQLGEWMDTLGY